MYFRDRGCVHTLLTLYVYATGSKGQRSGLRLGGGAENAGAENARVKNTGVENAGVENVAPAYSGGKNRDAIFQYVY